MNSPFSASTTAVLMMIAPRRIVVMTMVLAIMTIAPVMAQSDPKAPAMAEETRLTLGTATPGGGFPVYGDGLRRDRARRPIPRSPIEARNTKGSAENIPLLEEGKLDIALVQGEAAYEALAGIGRAAREHQDRLGDVFVAGACSWCGPTAPTARSPTCKGKPVAWGAQGLGPRDPRALRARSARARSRPRLPGDLPRARRRRARDGAGRPRRGAVGRRHRLAGLHDDGASAGRRALHRADDRTRSTASSPSTRS